MVIITYRLVAQRLTSHVESRFHKQGDMKMKHLFISHADVNDAFNTASDEEVKKFFDLTSSVAKKTGFEIVFWGNPWGVSESLTFITKAEKSLDEYIVFRQAFARELAERKMQSYFSKTRITVTQL